MRRLAVVPLFLAMAVLGAAQTYTFDILGSYASPTGDPASPFAGASFELKFSTTNAFFATPSGPDFTTLTNITYTNNGVTRVPSTGFAVLCTTICNGTETGGLFVTVNGVIPPGGDSLTLQLSGQQLFAGSIASPTVLTGIFPLTGGGVGGTGALYLPSNVTQSVVNTLVVITSQNPLGPVISNLTPSAVASGGPSFPLTVNGSGFQPGAIVQWNQIPLVTTFVNSGQLIANVPFNLITFVGTANISVANPGPVVSNTVSFGVGTVGTGTLTILNATPLPSGQVGRFYSQQLSAIGGLLPYTWFLASGALPAGLTLSASGLISGTPTTLGTSNFTIGVADNAFASVTLPTAITISSQTFDFTSALRVAQIVDGSNWKTLFAIMNLDQVPVNYVTRFWDDNGSSLALPIVNGSPGTLSGALAVNGIVFAETPGTAAALTQGWAEVASTGRIAVLVIFRRIITGKPDSEGTVNGVPSGNRIVMPFDNTSGFVTSVAVANTNPSQSLTISMLFQTENGAQSSGSLTLAPHAHTAFVTPTNYPFLQGVRGSITFTAPTGDITLMGLRFNPNGSFTAESSFQ